MSIENYVMEQRTFMLPTERILCFGDTEYYFICRDIHEKGEPWKNTIQVRFRNLPELPVW